MKTLIALSLVTIFLTGCADQEALMFRPTPEVTTLIPCDANNCGKLPQ